MDSSSLFAQGKGYPVPALVEIIQPCSEACVCFQRLPGAGWSDYGLCTNPRSASCGFPALIGQECRVYRPAGPGAHPRQV